MGTIRLPKDFKEFLRLLNSNGVEYLVIGGYAVNYYRYPRTTGDMDLWVGNTPENGLRVARALNQFGFSEAGPELFTNPNSVVRMGVPPLRLEILTSISGCEFSSCFARRRIDELDGVPVNMISLKDLRTNKRASARAKDLMDLEHLE